MENENNQDPSTSSPQLDSGQAGQALSPASASSFTEVLEDKKAVEDKNALAGKQGGGTSPIEIVDTSASAKASADKAEPIPVSPTPEPINLPTPPLEGGQNPPTPLYQGGETAPSPIKSLLLKAKEMIQFRKRKKLEKILDLAQTKQKITNNDIEKFLRVSDATATRYLSQLVKEGKLKPISRRGGAFYQLP